MDGDEGVLKIQVLLVKITSEIGVGMWLFTFTHEYLIVTTIGRLLLMHKV
jgi:hypothetical protein